MLEHEHSFNTRITEIRATESLVSDNKQNILFYSMEFFYPSIDPIDGQQYNQHQRQHKLFSIER